MERNSTLRLTGQHLWKEWREQRLLWLALVAALAAAALGLGLFGPERLIPADVGVWFVIIGLGAGFLTLAGDLVPGELRRGQFGFLLRSPGALRAAFYAKILVLLVGLGTLLLIGALLGELVLWLASGRELAERVASLGNYSWPAIAAIGIGVGTAAPWAFAVSCWLPRGASVVPVTALTLAAIVAPAALAVAAYDIPVSFTAGCVAVAFMFAGGICAAWLSFVRGLRQGRRPATVAYGLAAALVFVVPSWIWCAERIYTWHHADLTDPRMEIGKALLGVGGRTAFVGLVRNWGESEPTYAVAVDLRTGEWRQLGGAQSWVVGAGSLAKLEQLSGLHAPQPLVVHWQVDARGEKSSLLDGRTGELLSDCADFRVPGAFRDRFFAAASQTTPFLLPNGDRAWFEGRTVVFEDPAGRRAQVPWPESADWPNHALGYGLFWWDDEQPLRGRTVFDLVRRRNIELPDGVHTALVRPGAWIVGYTEPESWDPDTGARRPLPIDTGARIDGIAGDGRLLVVRRDGSAVLLDPDTERRDELTLEESSAHGTRRIARFDHAYSWLYSIPTRAPGGDDVYRVMFTDAHRNYDHTFARRVGTRLLPCVTTADEVEVFAIPDDDHVLVIRDQRTLERWRFGSDRVEVLFEVGTGGRP